MGESRSRTSRRSRRVSAVLAACLVAAACSSDSESSSPEPTTGGDGDGVTTITEDRAYYVLPPGNFGGLPTTDDSLDQLALYDGLTPLRDDISDDDLDEFFLPEDFEPVGETRVEDVGRAGTEVVYDEYGVPHITGGTRADLAFGAGWVTARDRGLLFGLGRGPARAAVVDVPGIDAFGLVTSGQQFVPSAAAEQAVTDQVQLILDTYGDEGREIIDDAQAYADGINAYWASIDDPSEPATVNDVIATTAFIGSIFGAGGGGEARNADMLAGFQDALGDNLGRQAWEDLLPTDDPEAPTTIEERFEYPALTGGDVTGSVVLDAGSIVSLDPAETPLPEGEGAGVRVDAVDRPPTRTASNFLTVAPDASANDTTMAVMGPQLGYFYPEIVQQMHLSGPGIEAQGAAVPGLSMYLLLGRTPDYAWSLTSAGQDVRDVFVEELCEPDGSPVTRDTASYRFEGACTPFERFDAGTLSDVPISYPTSVHGPVIGTATVDGVPVALTRQRSTSGRDALNLAALKDLTEGDGDTPESFFESADKFGFTFNWGYINRDTNAYFASGRLPVRAEGLDRRLPTLGNGDYEWQGFLDQDDHPHAIGHPSGRLLNWNNQSAPGFMHGDDNLYGSAHRVENFDQWPDLAELTDVVGIMNRAATEDVRSLVWPVISEVLASGDAPSELAAAAVAVLDDWEADDAPRLDADDDGDHDSAGPLLLDALFPVIAEAVRRPVLGPAAGVERQGLDDASFVDKDLRAVLGRDVDGPFALQYCGLGEIDACQASLWGAIDAALAPLAAERGDDPASWRAEGSRTSFVPGLIPETFRTTNRPTFQQVLELAPRG